MNIGNERIDTGILEAFEERAKKAAAEKQLSEQAAESYEPVETGLAELAKEVPAKAAATKKQGEQPGENAKSARPSEPRPASSAALERQSEQRAVSNANQTKQRQRSRPTANPAKQTASDPLNFDHSIALEFYNAVRPSAFVLGFTQGRHVTCAEEFQTLAKEADNKREHQFFHVATLKPEWTDPKTHEKGRIATAS